MLQLFETFSISQIAIAIVLLAVALREGVDFIEWVIKKGRQYFKKETLQEETDRDLQEQISEIREDIVEIRRNHTEDRDGVYDVLDMLDEKLEDITGSINLLIKSDRDDIKAYITEKYHHFIEQGWIDDYNLDCIEKRYGHYRKEGGNSFIEDLMGEIRKLPKRPPKK